MKYSCHQVLFYGLLNLSGLSFSYADFILWIYNHFILALPLPSSITMHRLKETFTGSKAALKLFVFTLNEVKFQDQKLENLLVRKLHSGFHGRSFYHHLASLEAKDGYTTKIEIHKCNLCFPD